MKILSVIPARGGSKGIPHKNIRHLAGKPLVAHTINSAQDSSYIQKVIVSTDDMEIGSVAQSFGADVVWRPHDLSGDKSPSEHAILHVLETLQESEGYCPDITVFLQCTSPLTSSTDIDGTIRSLLDEDADTALAVAPFHYFLWRRDDLEGAIGINHDKTSRLMRQAQEPQYLETGAVYVMRTEGFIKHKHRFFGKTVLYAMARERVLEIDEPSDFLLAELLIQNKKRG